MSILFPSLAILLWSTSAAAIKPDQKHLRVKTANPFTADQHVDGNLSVHEVESARPPSCVQNTGVSCLSEGCGSALGDAQCHAGQCHCRHGCSSGGSICKDDTNTLVVTGLRLKNAQWPTYYLVASTLDNYIHVANSRTDPLAQFNLYQLPGQGELPQYFLLVPKGSPAYSLSVIHKHYCSGFVSNHSADEDEEADVSDNLTNIAGHSCRHSWKAQTQPMSPSFKDHPSIQDIAVRLSQAPHPAPAGAVTIRGLGKHISRFMFIHEGTYKVITRPDDPGLGGYWIPDPPLPFKLPAYDGPPCNHNCGSSSIHTFGISLLLHIVLAACQQCI